MILPGESGRRQLALALSSTALLAFQIVLLQILATSQWHHFAAFVISCALLGFGAAGTSLSLGRTWMLEHIRSLLPALFSLSALFLVGALELSRVLFGGFDSLLLFVQHAESLRLAAVVLLLMLPFYCGALAIGLIFTAETERIGRHYFANMLGSGLGSLLGLIGLNWLFPDRLVPLCALLVLAAGGVLLPGTRRRDQYGLLGTLLLVAALSTLPQPLALSQYKDLSRVLDLPGTRVLAHRSSAAGQVHLLEAPMLRSAPGLSLQWTGPTPSRPVAFINGDLVGSLPPAPGSINPRDASTATLSYAIRSPHSVLILDARTGTNVAQALAHGAASVVAVAPHGALTATLTEFAPNSFGRLIDDPRVDWRTVAPRTWLARDPAVYDLVILPEVGGFGGNAGLFALREQPLLTREAITAAWQRLGPRGLLSITCWLDYPVRTPARLFATLVEAFEAAGVTDPATHMVALRSWGNLTFLTGRAPFRPEEIDRVRTFAARWAFDPLLIPTGLHQQERQTYSRLQDDRLFALIDGILGPERQALYRDYPFRLRPAHDDRPFFSQFLRWSRLDRLLALYGEQTLPFLELGLLVSGLAALVLSLLATLLILLPLTRLPRDDRQSGRTLLYFGGLGLGYMWVELAMIHRFDVFLGQPVYGAALVVAVMLTGSAAGSALSDRLSLSRPWRWCALVAAILLGYAVIMSPLLRASLPFSLAARVGVAIGVLAPAAFLMGMPFPIGLRRLNGTLPAAVPWAWGINGCCSVVGAAMATLIAVELGYSLLLLLAAGAYLVSVGAQLRDHT